MNSPQTCDKNGNGGKIEQYQQWKLKMSKKKTLFHDRLIKWDNEDIKNVAHTHNVHSRHNFRILMDFCECFIFWEFINYADYYCFMMMTIFFSVPKNFKLIFCHRSVFVAVSKPIMIRLYVLMHSFSLNLKLIIELMRIFLKFELNEFVWVGQGGHESDQIFCIPFRISFNRSKNKQNIQIFSKKSTKI